MLQRFSFCIYIIFFCVGLNAQPSARFQWNPYSAIVLPPHQYQIFMGQLPRYLSPLQITAILRSLTGISVRIAQHNVAEGYAFLSVNTEAERQRVLEFHHRIWTKPDGYIIIQEPLPQGTIVLEIPRHELLNTGPNGFFNAF